MAVKVTASAKLQLKLRFAGFRQLRQSRVAVETVARAARRVEAAAQSMAPRGVEVDAKIGPGRYRAGAVIMAHNVSPDKAGFLPAALDAGRG